MPPVEWRTEPRKGIGRVEMITIYRDRRDMSWEEAAWRLAEQKPLYELFNVVAIARDASPAGLGICFSGQHRRARNLLRPGERFILKLSFYDDPEDRPHVVDAGRDGRVSLLVKAVCRWFRAGRQGCAAGFELMDTNHPQVLDTFRRHLDVMPASLAFEAAVD